MRTGFTLNNVLKLVFFPSFHGFVMLCVCGD